MMEDFGDSAEIDSHDSPLQSTVEDSSENLDDPVVVDSCTFAYCADVWKWDAAVIASKRRNVEQGFTGDSEKVLEHNAGEASVDECNSPRLRKRKTRKPSKTSRSVVSSKEALKTGKWSEVTKAQVDGIAKAVAVFTIAGIGEISWYRMKELLPPDLIDSLWASVFSCAANFVLSVFDPEDFERVYKFDMIDRSYGKLYSSLLQFDGSPIEAIADGRIELNEYKALREHDVGEILQAHSRCYYRNLKGKFKGKAWSFGLDPAQIDLVDKRDLEIALEAVKKFVPLKDDFKIQLALESLHGTFETSLPVHDTLLLEAWKGITGEYRKFQSHLTEIFDDEKPDSAEELKDFEQLDMKPSEVAESELSIFALSFMGWLWGIAAWKHESLERFQDAAIFPLTCKTFGCFADEVLEVVRIADRERRMEGHHFISVQHILFGLSHSRVGYCVQWILRDRGLHRSAKELSNIRVYTVYKLSGMAARLFEDEEVGLEHLASAIFFMIPRSERMWICEANDKKKWDAQLLERLKKADSKPSSDVSGNYVNFDFVPEECLCFDGKRVWCHNLSSVEKPTRVFENGLKLPCIR